MLSESNPDGFSKGLISDVRLCRSTALECRTSRPIVHGHQSATFFDLSRGWFPDEIMLCFEGANFFSELWIGTGAIVLFEVFVFNFSVIFFPVFFPTSHLHGDKLPFSPANQGACVYHHHHRRLVLYPRRLRVYVTLTNAIANNQLQVCHQGCSFLVDLSASLRPTSRFHAVC